MQLSKVRAQAGLARGSTARKAVVVRAQESKLSVGQGAAAAAVATALTLGAVEPAKADIAGLTPCSESKAYQKRLKNEVSAWARAAGD